MNRSIPVLALLLALVVLVGVGATFLYSQGVFDSLLSPEKSNYSGTLYVSLRSLPAKSNPISIYSFDIQSKTLTNLSSDGGSYMASRFSHAKDRIAYTEFSGKKYLLYTVKNNFTEKKGVNVPPEAYIARNPSWSPDDRLLAYQTQSAQDGSILQASAWRVYVTNLSTNKTTFITDGVSPLFGPDGSLLILKEKGLYRFDINDPKNIRGELVWEVTGGVSLGNMKLDLSPSGKLLAWSVPHENMLYIFSVSSWNPFKIEIKSTINSSGFWPVFSPDEKYLAFEEATMTEPPSKPRLVIFNLQNLSKSELYDLSQYDQESMYVTDWQK